MIGRIYKIEVNENDFYIGSTIKSLKERETLHNNRLNKNIRTNKLYEKCRENNITKIICILLEEKEVENKEEIRMLEQEYIKELQPTLNDRFAYITEEEKKNIRKENCKEWRENKKEHIKEYYENNKEKIRKKNKKYRENNKDKISERQTEKIKCPICNKIVSRCNIAKHKKSKNCLSYKTI